MEQITLQRDTAQKRVEAPTQRAKFEIPKVEETIARIEEAEQAEKEQFEEEQEIEKIFGFIAGFFGFFAHRRAKRAAAEDEEERLAAEMEKIHPKEKKLGGCGCGM